MGYYSKIACFCQHCGEIFFNLVPYLVIFYKKAPQSLIFSGVRGSFSASRAGSYLARRAGFSLFFQNQSGGDK